MSRIIRDMGESMGSIMRKIKGVRYEIELAIILDNDFSLSKSSTKIIKPKNLRISKGPRNGRKTRKSMEVM